MNTQGLCVRIAGREFDATCSKQEWGTYLRADVRYIRT